MGHQVLARKWRPKSFADVLGQEHVVRVLTSALEQNRLHQAYLFTGTRGVGKTTLARIFARCLNCRQGVAATPCGTCTTCTEMDENRHQDFIEMDAATHTGVDDIRQLLEDSYYPPAYGRFKIYLIDEVHMLSGSSFNAMLKTLEEPPEHIMFLLATTEPQKLLATVLSRCLQLNLKGMSMELIAGYLERVLADEGVEAEAEALRAIAGAAQGSVRDALTLTDQAIGFADGGLRADEVHRMLGTLDGGVLEAMIKALFARDAERLLEEVESLAKANGDYERALEGLLDALHSVAMVQMLGTYDRGRLDNARIRDLAATVTAEDVQMFYQIGLLAHRDMLLAADSRQGLEMALLRMLAFTQNEEKSYSEPTPQGGAGAGSVDANEPPSASLSGEATPSEASDQPASTEVAEPQDTEAAQALEALPMGDEESGSGGAGEAVLEVSAPEAVVVADEASLPTAQSWPEDFNRLNISSRARAHFRDLILIGVESGAVCLGQVGGQFEDIPRSLLEEVVQAVQQHWPGVRSLQVISADSVATDIVQTPHQLHQQQQAERGAEEEKRVRALPAVMAFEQAFGIERLSITHRADGQG